MFWRRFTFLLLFLLSLVLGYWSIRVWTQVSCARIVMDAADRERTAEACAESIGCHFSYADLLIAKQAERRAQACKP
jgi:hypothetical protein